MIEVNFITIKKILFLYLILIVMILSMLFFERYTTNKQITELENRIKNIEWSK